MSKPSLWRAMYRAACPLPTLFEVSDWVLRCKADPARNRWGDRVDHMDAVAIAKAAIHDFAHDTLSIPEETP